MKTYKHIELIQLSDIKSLFDINLLSLTINETEQFGVLSSIEGQTYQLVFGVINENIITNTHFKKEKGNHSSQSYFIDSMSSLSSISTLSNSIHHHGNNKIHSSFIRTLLKNSEADSD
ncbi:unnamed protein product [Rotaria sordida]|uniref:Uncharacterized protein n=1 Tax=Rotaria sordida TaxID=392033 RepID=A0A818JHM4_9BILA|nr:unnamed protein product [Rotaria sordida]CAF3602263.1 unnamed protein product [Rotaria sordida]